MNEEHVYKVLKKRTTLWTKKPEKDYSKYFQSSLQLHHH